MTLASRIDSIIQWTKENPKKTKGFRALLRLVSIAITIFLLVSAARHYEAYEKRPSYYLRIDYENTTSPNTTANVFSYIIRENATVKNCSAASKFPGDASIAYYTVVKKPPTNSLIIAVFVSNVIVVGLLGLFDIYYLVILLIEKNESEIDKSKIDKKKIFWSFLKKLFLKAWQLATIAAPTYYISAFDYSQVCLQFNSADVSAIAIMPIALIFPYLGIIGIVLVYISSCCIKRKCDCSSNPYESIRQTTHEKKLLIFCICINCSSCGLYVCVTFFLVFGIGFFLCVMIALKQVTRAEGVLIALNLFV